MHQPTSPTARPPVVAVSIGAAAGAIAATFRGPQARFWARMTASSLGLAGSALALSAAYAGVHLVTGNVALVAAAAAAGGCWGVLSAVGAPLGALIVSHVGWDLWMFLLQPIPAGPEGASAATVRSRAVL